MSRTFIYARVSTSDQNADNQVHEIETAGFSVSQRRIVTECISGSVPASERPQFSKLLDRLEPGDVLIVSKLGVEPQTLENSVTSGAIRLEPLVLGSHRR